MAAYYNEFDAFAAQWLRSLIDGGLIPHGDVDERSIVDVRPADLAGYDQCHFFAGIGGWPLALRLAGWPDDRPVWTGSCPCQPLSGAGLRKGHADERHLWPAFHRLIAERAPATVFGEQVASADGREWLAAVRADLEALGHAVGAADLCAAGVGAPHIRQRLFWVANATGPGWIGRRTGQACDGAGSSRIEFGRFRDVDGVADADRGQRDGIAGSQECQPDRQAARRDQGNGQPERCCAIDGVEHADRKGRDAGQPAAQADRHRGAAGPNGGVERVGAAVGGLADMPGERREWGADTAGEAGRRRPEDCGALGGRPSAHHGGWNDADWLFCTDGKWRPVEPGTFPLAHGVPGRMGRLRAYGNAIVPQVAAVFIRAVVEDAAS